MREITPEEIGRAQAWKVYKDVPIPVTTVFKKTDITPLFALKEQGHKLNMLLCYCILSAAAKIPQFYTVIKKDKFYLADKLCYNVAFYNSADELRFVDVPYAVTLEEFEQTYLAHQKIVYEGNKTPILHDYAKISLSCVPTISDEGVVNAYNPLRNHPSLIWGAFRAEGERQIVLMSFQFHHGQMDGIHSACFLNRLQEEIDNLH